LFSALCLLVLRREEEKARLGRDFKLKDFNNRFLSYGSAPVRNIRELMREDH